MRQIFNAKIIINSLGTIAELVHTISLIDLKQSI